MLSERQIFLEHLAQTSEIPLMLEIDSAEGIYMYDKNNKQYIDLISGIGVSNVGHRHPRVIQAIQNQLDKYLHLMVYGEFIQSPQTQLAKALAATLPESLQVVYFVNSGSEAVEGALKIAKRFTGRYQVISCFNAYHGSTQGALSVCGNESFKQAYRPLIPGSAQIHHGNLQDLEKITSKTAAVIIEPIQGEAGVRFSSKSYFKALREKCNQTGTLIIADEIQTGYGRTGKFWAMDHYELSPDILVCAKGMGGGMPIGAFIGSHEVMEVIKNNPALGHITTFGGHPVSAVASLAAFQVIREENLAEQAIEKGALFNKHLNHPKIKEIRQSGLFIALEFENFKALRKIINQAIAMGLVTDWFLFCDNAMRIAPPLTITEPQIKNACNIINEAIEKASNQ